MTPKWLPIGLRLRRARKRMRYSQQDVMKALGHKNTTRISQWENGIRLPGIINIMKLSALYKTLPDELFYELRLHALSGIETWMQSELKKRIQKKDKPP